MVNSEIAKNPKKLQKTRISGILLQKGRTCLLLCKICIEFLSVVRAKKSNLKPENWDFVSKNNLILKPTLPEYFFSKNLQFSNSGPESHVLKKVPPGPEISDNLVFSIPLRLYDIDYTPGRAYLVIS